MKSSKALVWPDTREQQKQGRREEILAAAEALVRETCSTDFSVGVLAERAGVSVATLYNLIGPKGTILYALLNLAMDQLEQATRDLSANDPYELALSAAEAVAAVYTADADYLRPLWRFELGVIEPEHRPALMNRALAFWADRLRPLDEAGIFPKGIERIDLAREYQIFFAGVLDLWVQHELSNPQFLAQVRYGILLRLLALSDDAARERLLKLLRSAHRRLRSLARAPI